MDKHRLQRVASDIQHHIARLIHDELDDPRAAFINVTSVKVSADLGVAKIYVIFRETEDKETMLKLLQESAKFLRFRLAHSIVLRKTPELHFYYDESLERGIRINELLK